MGSRSDSTASILLGLYRSATRFGFCVWAALCIKPVLEQLHLSSHRPKTDRVETTRDSSLLDWDSPSARRFSNALFISLPLDVILMRMSSVRVPLSLVLHHLFGSCLYLAYRWTQKGIFYGCLFGVTELYGALSMFEHLYRNRRARLALCLWRVVVLLGCRLPIWCFITTQAYQRSSKIVCKLGCVPMLALDLHWLSRHLTQLQTLL